MGFLWYLGVLAVFGILLWLAMIVVPGRLTKAKWKRQDEAQLDQRLLWEGWRPDELPRKKDELRERDKSDYGAIGYVVLLVSFGVALFAFSLW